MILAIFSNYIVLIKFMKTIYSRTLGGNVNQSKKIREWVLTLYHYHLRMTDDFETGLIH